MPTEIVNSRLIDALKPFFVTWSAYQSGSGGAFSGAQVYNSAAQNILNNTLTTLTFNSERFDTHDFHSTVTNTDRLTIPADGIYLVVLTIEWQQNTTGYRAAYITTSAVGKATATDLRATAAVGPAQTVTLITDLSAGDYLTARVLQNSGSTIAVNFSAYNSPNFSVARIG